jgi:hypothetical protein
MDKEAREFSKKLLGRGAFRFVAPPRPLEESGKTEEPQAEPAKRAKLEKKR